MIHSISGRQQMCSDCNEVFHFSVKHVCPSLIKETVVEKVKKIVKKVSSKKKTK